MGAPIDHFKFCPQCAAALPDQPSRNPLRCLRCEFTFYFNPAVAAAAFIEDANGRLLLLRRSKEPARGKLSLPGGFVDFAETAEVALRREVREEVGLDLGELTFLSSQVNHYTYRQITYPVLDLFFKARSASTAARALDGADSVGWFDPAQVPMAELSFPSVQAAWIDFLARR